MFLFFILLFEVILIYQTRILIFLYNAVYFESGFGEASINFYIENKNKYNHIFVLFILKRNSTGIPLEFFGVL